MDLTSLTSGGPIPVLEAALRFSAARQRVLNHNIANISTPDFRPLGLSTEGFRRALADAIDRKRSRPGAEPLRIERTGELETRPDGTLVVTARSASGNILFHDRNDRDLERLMQGLAENSAAYRVTSELLRSRYDLLRTAISQRP